MTQDELPTYQEASADSSALPSRSSTWNSTSSAPVHESAQASSSSTPSPSKARKPLGPRSPLRADTLPSSPSSRRDQAGSSRTTFVTSPIRAQSSGPPAAVASPTSRSTTAITPLMTSEPLPTRLAVEEGPTREDGQKGEGEDAAHPPYRDPEVITEIPEQVPGFVPGVVAEHLDEEDGIHPPASPIQPADPDLVKMQVDSWQAEVRPYDGGMDIDGPDQLAPQRPQIGPGISLRRMLQIAHPHDLFRAHVVSQPVYNARTKTEALGNPFEKRYGPAHIRDAGPGGHEGYGQWFFCPTCWAWMRIRTGWREPDVPDMAAWERAELPNGVEGATEEENADRQARQSEMTTFTLLKESRSTRSAGDPDHFHAFKRLLPRESGDRLHRVKVDDPEWCDFPAVLSDLQELGLREGPDPATYPTLYMSCTSDEYYIVSDPVPGQIPRDLARRLTEERVHNPRPGARGPDALEAWELLAKILGTVLFLGERNWLKLESNTMSNKLGRSDTVSLLLYCLGFGCKLDETKEFHRSGPFSRPSGPDYNKRVLTDAEIERMDHYMMRTWLEIEIHNEAYRRRNHIDTHPGSNGMELERATDLFDKRPRLPHGYPDRLRDELATLGVAKNEIAEAIIGAYKLQCACDEVNRPAYLSALVKLSDENIIGKEELQLAAMMERSMMRYTLEDLQAAYSLVGYTVEHESEVGIDAASVPDDYILELHKKAVQNAPTSQAKAEIMEALKLIGKHRNSNEMLELASSGRTMMSVQEAYEALSCPRDAVDDGLIMQYEMAVNEYPGKTDHYRKCLDIIADAQDNERPGIKQFLSTGTLGPPAPVRKDIPVGLQNIGNTCYLNSILQYLYSIKPLRDAVIDFEQTESVTTAVKPDVERSKRFVRQLRLLFLQLYGSATPSVRPDEELAYLAITRPEVDAIIEPAPDTVKPGKITLDTIPDIPTPTISTSDLSSTRPATPEAADVSTATSAEDGSSPADTRGSVLGKRASQDRDSVGSSDDNRHRLKSESRISESELVESPFMESAPSHTAIDATGRSLSKQDSVGPVNILADLKLKSAPSSPSPGGEQDGEEGEEQIEAMEGGMLLGLPEPAAARPSDHLAAGSKKEAEADDDFVEYEPPSLPPPLPARPPARRQSTLASGLKFGLQQDSAEVLINVLSQLELAFDPPKAEEGDVQRKNLISELFSCTYHQQMFVQAADGSTERRTPVESVFVHPIIGVEEEGKDLYDCLAELYLFGSEIEYEGKKGYIMDHMERFPPLLYIQMRRSQFDLATGRERKTNTHIPFGQTLAMDRFLSTAEPEKREKSMALTREMTRLRARLHELRDRKPLSMPDTFAHVFEALGQFNETQDHDIPDGLLDMLKSEGEGMKAEIAGMVERLSAIKVELDDLWKDDHEYEYELVSVFMHRGKTSGAGHYWTYQAYLPEHGERFFKYNDELVTEVPASEVLEDRTGSDANPALLCYVRKGKDLVHTLHRRILEEGTEDAELRPTAQVAETEERQAVEHVEDIVMDGQT